MQTAVRIDLINQSVDIVGEGDEPVVVFVVLSVNFRVTQQGPAHVAGIIVTNDFWVTSKTDAATFQRFDGGTEIWQVSFSVQGSSARFEYVIFCDDFGGVDQVPRIWNTNGGNRFQIGT